MLEKASSPVMHFRPFFLLQYTVLAVLELDKRRLYFSMFFVLVAFQYKKPNYKEAKSILVGRGGAFILSI